MLRKRMLFLLGGCFLTASAAWADDVGYVDCSNHPEGTQVFAKARKSPDVTATVPCGERFTILLYGFIFSRVQTGDGKVGYVFSNLISVDRAGAAAQRPAAAPAPAAASASSSNVPGTTVAGVSNPGTVTQPQPTSTQPVAGAATAQTAGPGSSVPDTTPTAVPSTPAPVAQPQPTPAQPDAPAAPAQAPLAASDSSRAAAATTGTPDPPAVSQPQPPAPPPAASGYETVGATVQPSPASVAPPEPATAQPAAPAIRPANTGTSWERPTPGGRRRTPRLELFGGYAFARLDGGGGSWTNVSGAMGSFGWNIKSWLQFVGDSSYNVVTISGTKNVLYGNHYGARLFRNGRNRWGVTPFVEGLIGGSRIDTTVSGTGGYSVSDNGLSYKVGGGLDFHPSRHFEIRLLDVDYYRTSFGSSGTTAVHQNNYWASAGIVLRLFGGGAE